jgi:RNA polymerase sigma-70 factor (ECF subfamily)
MELDDDKVLVERMLAGDSRAFDAFFNAYFDRLYRFALIRLRNEPVAAEDIVQQTLCRAIEKLHYFRGEAALFTWLCQICRNAIADMFRSKEYQAGQPIPFEDSEEVRSALEALSALPLDDPQQSMQDEQLRRFVHVILDHLPRRYADALEWKYIQGLSVKEIAERLHVGPKAAESVLTRARAAFREGFDALGRADAFEVPAGGAHD